MVAKAKNQDQKEKTMDLVDLRGSKLLIKVRGEVEVEKVVVWDNTDGRRGVIKASYLNITVTGEKGKQRFIIGSKDKNLWFGKELKKKEQAAEKQVMEL